MTSNSIQQIPFNGQIIEAQKQGDSVFVALTPICNNLGLDAKSQRNRIDRQPWATGVMMTSVGADGKQHEMFMIDRRTFTMWLATIDTSRLKSEAAKDVVIAYQKEAADALDRYFNSGVVVNEHLLNAQHLRRMQNMELLKAAEGLIHPDFLEAKARIVLARETGEIPELDPTTRPLYVQDYLGGLGIHGKALGRMAGVFGKTLKRLYVARHGMAPDRADITTGSGQIRKVYAYTEASRDLFDQTWAVLNHTIGKAA
ncbi:phage antirepressor N-terminal domain-containing protein [Bifidobacterium mongoliense]|uniref:Putative prophage antirepressor n=1 Tax=Bifidobacterium mongoliense DSM 21395 TaxID=1437603 RepID=A0A087CAJ6_9BIFI|nr:phage antirepressor N-terminal domain-containing protein [Bifidobacterium mongoliense]KFI80296.1 putative prophage antirepressor [Bifidobacterium mongoliense DSM 21395]